tara:strand:+ start:682 stop:921 length:240 start_codon:yes stop_codon:yes gene_type:complete
LEHKTYDKEKVKKVTANHRMIANSLLDLDSYLLLKSSTDESFKPLFVLVEDVIDKLNLMWPKIKKLEFKKGDSPYGVSR